MIESKKNFSLLFMLVLFLSGCVTTQEYVYKDDTFRTKSEVSDKNQIKEEKEEWIGYYLNQDSLLKQCPTCERRYQNSLEKCPYDNAELEEISNL